MDLTGFNTAYEGIRKLIDGVREAIKIRQDIAVDKATAQIYDQLDALRAQLMTLHAEYDTVLRAKNDAESALVTLEQALIDKSRYQLKQLPAGAFVYCLKPEHQGAEPLHHLCAHCYGKNVLSLLQPGGIRSGHRVLRCNTCEKSFINEPWLDTYPLKQPEGKNGAW